jgi:hypothetical protein
MRKLVSRLSGRFIESQEDKHFDNAIVGANIQHLATELVSQSCNGIQMLVLVSECLTARQVAGVEFLSRPRQRPFLAALLPLAFYGIDGCCDLTMVLEQFLEELGAQNADLGQKEFTLYERRVRVIEHSPNRDKIIQLAASLLNDSVLTLQHDGHARQILHLGIADDKTVNVEAAGRENPRDTREHTGLVLYQTVQDMTLRWVCRANRGLIED